MPLFHVDDEQLWPGLEGVAAEVARLDTSGDTRKRCVLLTTGAMNPPHLGHVEMMKSAKQVLDASGWAVLGAWLSPSHDKYVLPKCQSLKTPHVPSKGRCRLAELVVQAAHSDSSDDTWTAGTGAAEGRRVNGGTWLHIGRWESADFHKRWPDFPEVLDALGKATNAAASKIVPIYVCGTDHASKCGLDHGLGEGQGVAIVQRASEQPAKASAENMVFAIPPNANANVAALSSTKLRKVLVSGKLEVARKLISEAAVDLIVANDFYGVSAATSSEALT